MTDRPEPSADAVELASRYLDGDLDVAERAAAEDDAEVMMWVARLGDVQRALRTPVDVDATHRESALAAALSAFDHEVAGTTETGPVAPVVTDLAAARRRRAGRLGTWLGAAAAAAAVAVGGVAVSGNLGGSTASDADSATELSAADTTAVMEHARDAAGDGGAILTAEAPTAIEDAAPAATTLPSSESTTTARDSAATTAAGATTAADPEMTTAPMAYSFDTADIAAYAAADPVELPAGETAPCTATSDGALVAVDLRYADVPVVVYRVDAARTIDIYAVDGCALLESFGY